MSCPLGPANNGARGLRQYRLVRVGSILKLKCIPLLQTARVRPRLGNTEMSAAVICDKADLKGCGVWSAVRVCKELFGLAALADGV